MKKMKEPIIEEARKFANAIEDDKWNKELNKFILKSTLKDVLKGGK